MPSSAAGGAVRLQLESALRRTADLAAELAALEASTAEGPDDEHDPDGSTVGFERARVGALLARSRAEVDALRRALGRLNAGTYGRCSLCATTIPAERLEALPATTVCVTCASTTPAHGGSLRDQKPGKGARR